MSPPLYFEVQVRRGRVAALSAESDRLSIIDALPGANAQAGQMRVDASDVGAVLYDHDETVTSGFSCKGDGARLHCQHRRADRDGQIDAFV